MSKLQAMFVGAAALLVAGGITVGIALRDSGISVGMTCPQWCAATKRASDPQKLDTFFVAVADGATIPKAYGDRVLGDCSGGTCTLQPTGCHCSYTYSYDLGPLVAGWRVARVTAHPYFAAGWRLTAAGESDFKWFESWKEVITVCKANLTPAQCANILEVDSHCWRLSDGNFCRYGREYGPGLGGSEACRNAEIVNGLPCTVNRGAGSEVVDENTDWSDEKFDEL